MESVKEQTVNCADGSDEMFAEHGVGTADYYRVVTDALGQSSTARKRAGKASNSAPWKRLRLSPEREPPFSPSGEAIGEQMKDGDIVSNDDDDDNGSYGNNSESDGEVDSEEIQQSNED